MGQDRINWEISYDGTTWHYQGGVLIESWLRVGGVGGKMRYHHGANGIDEEEEFTEEALHMLASALDDEHLMMMTGPQMFTAPNPFKWVRDLPRDVREQEMMPALRDWSRRQKGAK